MCGWPDLAEPPLASFEICPSCGTEFGLTDDDRSHAELRDRWIARGMPFVHADEQPADWNPVAQLRAAGLPTDAS